MFALFRNTSLPSVLMHFSHLSCFKEKFLYKNINDILLYHDNALLLVAHTVMDFFNARSIAAVAHPQFSPHLIPCDF